jgi:ABC-2 type transport system permease protein
MNALKNWSQGWRGSLWAEWQKLRRSRTFWITALAFGASILIAGLFMYILKDPEQARRFGLLGAKATILGGTADWPSYINVVLLMVSVLGIIIYGFIYVWIFGREFSDKTFYDLLALPTSRITIVLSKFVTGMIWCLVLLTGVIVLMTVLGLILNLPGWSLSLLFNGIGKIALSAFLTALLAIPFAFIASITKSYLPAVGCIFLVLALGQVFSSLGYGQFFPWSVPALLSGAAGTNSLQPGIASYISVGMVCLLGLICTLIWWQKADHS